MARRAEAGQPGSRHGQEDAGDGRNVVIDILRGLAILWVILFHLWGDIKFFPPGPHEYYRRFLDQARAGDALHSFTAVTDILLRDGFQGVPLFMMLSGLSLALGAHRTGGNVNWGKFYVKRLRRLLIPYWLGWALALATMAAVAAVQVRLDGGDFMQHFTRGVTISVRSHILLDRGVVLAGLLVLPRLVNAAWFFAPEYALWFVVLLLQYYLLFPLLYLLMRRIGPLPVVAAALALNIAASWCVIDHYVVLELRFSWVTGWSVFRLFEFTLGMAMGMALAEPERLLGRFLRSPFALLLVPIGLAVHTAGDLLDSRYGYWATLITPLVILGLTLMVTPAIFSRPGRLVLNPAGRLLAFVGVISYAVLIINDPLRFVASELRAQHVPGAWWWLFLTAVYVPLSVLLAWPLAKVVGLMPERRAAARSPAPQAGVLQQPMTADAAPGL